MELRIAEPGHSFALCEFYKGFTIKWPVELMIERGRDYFLPYEIQSEDHLTYILTEHNKIHGTASFVVSEALIQNRPTPIAFGRDLRISSNRQAILNWANHFQPVMKEVTSAYNCKYLFAIMSLSDVQAQNTFVRPRNPRRRLPRYYMYRRFNLVSLHGRFPWASIPLPHIQIRQAQPKDYDALQYYIIQKSQARDLALVWDSQSFQRKLGRWKGLELKDFWLAFDSKGNIVGCAAPWSAKGIQEFIPLTYNLRAHNFRQFLKFGKLFGWTHSMTKPVTRLHTETPLEFRYLNFFYAETADIFETLAWKIFDTLNSNEFLIYVQMRSDPMFRRPINWVSAKMPYAIYCLVSPDREPPEFLSPYNERACDVEPFFC